MSFLPSQCQTPLESDESKGSKGASSLTSLHDIVDALQGFSHRYDLEVQDSGVRSAREPCRKCSSTQGFVPKQRSNVVSLERKSVPQRHLPLWRGENRVL